MDHRTTEESVKADLSQNSDVIFLISEDEEEEMSVSAEQKPKQIVKDEPQQTENGNPAESAVNVLSRGNDPAVNTLSRGNDFGSCDLVNFIRRHCDDNIYSSNPKDVIEAVSDKPYCLYLYVGEPVGEGQSTSFVLIGYFDQNLDRRVVKLLHTLQMSVDTADPQNLVDLHTDTIKANSDACLLIETLEKLDLPLSNLAVFFCSAPQSGLSQFLVSQLQTFSPKLISLCSIPGMAGRACQAGLRASFKHVVGLITDIYCHYASCPSVNDSLKEVFADTAPYDPLCPIAAQCSFIAQTVQKMTACWHDLLEYFKSLKQTEATDRIRIQLMDSKVQLNFLFLSHSLEPLRALQDLQQSGTADLTVEFQLTSILFHSYATSILRSSAVHHFLWKREFHLLSSEQELLPLAKVNIGSQAKDFICITTMNWGEQDRSDFQRAAQSFYRAALESLMESTPQPLNNTTLNNIALMLKDPKHILDRHFPRYILSVMGVQLGLCTPGVSQTELRQSYSTFIKRLSGDPTWNEECISWTKAYKNIKIPPNREETPKASPQPGWWTRRSSSCRRKLPANLNRKEGDGESLEDTDCTDNSSDVIDVTDEFKRSPTSKLTMAQNEGIQQGEFVLVVTSDEEDHSMDSTVTTPQSLELLEKSVGELVWGQMEGFSPWPGIIVPLKRDSWLPEKRMVEWYGQRMCSQVCLKALQPFAAFGQHFCANSFATLVTYREAIFSCLQEAALRCNKQFSSETQDCEELLKEMLNWAFGGFQPSGPDGLKPINGVLQRTTRPKVKKKLFRKSTSFPELSDPLKSSSFFSTQMKEVSVSLDKLSCSSIQTFSQSTPVEEKSSKSLTKKSSNKGLNTETRKHGKGEWGEEIYRWGVEWKKMTNGWGRKRGRGSLRGGRGFKKTYSLFNGFDADMSPDFVPYKRKSDIKGSNKVNQTSSMYTQPDQKVREETIQRIRDLNLDIEGYCLCCGTEDIQICHPLFKGSLCSKCKDNFTETLYRYDDDGYQSYCTICCYGLEVILCGNDSCCRSYCEDCLNILVGPGTFESLKLLDPWICYMCQPHQPHGALVPREDWSIRVQELFVNNSAMEFERHRVYPSIPANLRRPVRVLSLFDGIGTGFLVLKELGFKVEKYVASEVCEDSVAVSTINHDGKITNVGDVRFITQEQLEKWGPFDLLMGGSPCNDLSIVNPIRKGLYEGTGRLFFEYFRILQLLKPKEDDPRPFFWLFENVVFMNTHDKVNICRFLECNPVLVDAVKVSPAHRARYFWGNIPGMSRPIIASQNDKMSLQDCLEMGRQARVTKVRTITTNPNSLKQGKDVSLLPVIQDGKEDTLWITELEKIFGFPKHYTDVRNMNRQQRQKLLGKAWSVPVIRHLFAPLKEYFACEELPHVTVASPPSPDLQQQS